MTRAAFAFIPFIALVGCKSDEDTDLVDTDDTDDTDVADTDVDTDDTDDTDVEPQGDIEAIGRWIDGYGAFQEITNESWETSYAGGDPSVVEITEYDNEAHWAVGQNGPDNGYFPDLWSKFEWVAVDGGFAYCQIAYDAADADAAKAFEADQSDLAAGCNGFPWSTMVPALDIRGAYTDAYGGEFTFYEDEITFYGSVYAVDSYSNSEHWIIAQNGADNTYFPSLWSNFEWTIDSGDLYYCQIAYNAADRDAALEADADETDLAAGCSGFSWSPLDAQ